MLNGDPLHSWTQESHIGDTLLSPESKLAFWDRLERIVSSRLRRFLGDLLSQGDVHSWFLIQGWVDEGQEKDAFPHEREREQVEAQLNQVANDRNGEIRA